MTTLHSYLAERVCCVICSVHDPKTTGRRIDGCNNNPPEAGSFQYNSVKTPGSANDYHLRLDGNGRIV